MATSKNDIIVPIYWRDLTDEAKERTERMLKKHDANVRFWIEHFKAGKVPVTEIILEYLPEKENE